MNDAPAALKPWPGALAWLTVQLLLITAWIALLAHLPWWIGLGVLLALDAATVWSRRRAFGTADQWLLFYGALGLIGLALSLAQAIGGVWGWAIAAVAAVAGFAWKLYLMQRFDLPRGVSKQADVPSLALASAQATPRRETETPTSVTPVHWRQAGEAATREEREAIWQRGEPVYQVNGEIRFGPSTGDYLWPDGSVVIAQAGSGYAISDDGHWFVASSPVGHPGRCDYLYDRARRLLYRLPAWELRGWSERGPWLAEPGKPPVLLDRIGATGVDYLPLRDLWLPRNHFAELPLARRALPAPLGHHVAVLDIDLPDRLLDGNDPMESLRRPCFLLHVDGQDSGLRLYGVYGQPWSDDGRTLRVSAWLADAPRLTEPWLWSQATGWLRADHADG